MGPASRRVPGLWTTKDAKWGDIPGAASLEELVQIAARSRAVKGHGDRALTLAFVGDSPWRGNAIALRSRFSCQHMLP